jgi:hypothetical protein
MSVSPVSDPYANQYKQFMPEWQVKNTDDKNSLR